MTAKSPHLVDDTLAMLIKEVKKRGCLWNSDNEDYNDRYHTMVAWKEIASVLELPEDMLRTKWKSLRDMFKREYKKCQVNSVQDYKGKWRNFQAMWFILPKNKTRTTDEEQNDSHDGTYSETNEPYVKFEPADFTEVEFLEDAEDPIQPKRTKTSVSDDDFDMMFLKSLTPYFRELDPIRKLVVRSKMQDMLLNEIAAQQSSNAPLASSYK